VLVTPVFLVFAPKYFYASTPSSASLGVAVYSKTLRRCELRHRLRAATNRKRCSIRFPGLRAAGCSAHLLIPAS